MKKSGSPKKRRPRPPRVALRLPRDPQGLYTRGLAIWAAIQADPKRYPNPYPSALEIEGDLAALGAALQAAVGGDPVALTALIVAAEKARQTLNLLGGYVQSIVRAGAIEDAAETIGNALMYMSNIGNKAPKPELAVEQGVSSGIVMLIALAVPSAIMYFWEHSLDQVSWTAGAQSAQARCNLSGLVPGKVYYFRFHVFKRHDGMTEASQVVAFLVK